MFKKKVISALLLGFMLFITSNASAAIKFSDIHHVKWAEEDIYFLANKGIINGYGNGKFGPNDKVTRGQAALMLVNTLYPKEVPTKPNEFIDLKKGSYYYDAVLVAKEKGLINGYANGTFKGDHYITRAEVAILIDHAFQISRGNHKVSFSDVAKEWYTESVVDLASQKIINGYNDGTFKPANHITRAEFSCLLASAIKYQLGLEDSGKEKDSDKNGNPFIQEVITLTNEYRVENGLKPLQEDLSLSKVAQLKSEDMRKNNYFDHTSPTYGSPFDMMKQFGIHYRAAGENIAYGYRTPEAVVNGWINSPGHRANILNSSFTHIGIGYDSQGHYWTQMFIGK